VSLSSGFFIRSSAVVAMERPRFVNKMFFGLLHGHNATMSVAGQSSSCGTSISPVGQQTTKLIQHKTVM
jgi:hypothetical protein